MISRLVVVRATQRQFSSNINAVHYHHDKQLLLKLREATGLGFQACANALKETEGDYSMALQKMMQLNSARPLELKTCNEGAILIRDDSESIGILKIYCQSDFVARSHTFKELADDIWAIKTESMDNKSIFENIISKYSQIFKESINTGDVYRIAKQEAAIYGKYLHNKFPNGLGTAGAIAVLLTETHGSVTDSKTAEFANKLCSHIVGFKSSSLEELLCQQFLFAKSEETVADALGQIDSKLSLYRHLAIR